MLEIALSKNLQERVQRKPPMSTNSVPVADEEINQQIIKLTQDLTGLVVLRMEDRPMNRADKSFDCLLTDVRTGRKSMFQSP